MMFMLNANLVRVKSWLKKQTSKWFYSILDKISQIEIQRDTGDFRLFDRRAVEALKNSSAKPTVIPKECSLGWFSKQRDLFINVMRV